MRRRVNAKALKIKTDLRRCPTCGEEYRDKRCPRCAGVYAISSGEPPAVKLAGEVILWKAHYPARDDKSMPVAQLTIRVENQRGFEAFMLALMKRGVPVPVSVVER